MTAGQQLRAIGKLTMKDGLKYDEVYDIGRWLDICGPDQDTTLLQPKSIERIQAIFERFFEVC